MAYKLNDYYIHYYLQEYGKKYKFEIFIKGYYR